MSKIIFLDIDGTLVDYKNNLPKSAVKAIQQARANQHRIYLCTGRSKAEIYQELWDIGLDGIIGGNGSYIEDHGNVIFHQMISSEQCKKIVDWLHSRKLEFYLESNNGLFASEHFAEKAEHAIQEYSKRKGKNYTVSSAFPNMIYHGELYRNDLNKISYLLNSYQDYLDAKEQFPDMENGTWGGAKETALFGDFSVKGISKENAVTFLLSYLGAKQEDTIAFGDAKVDIPMLKYCHIGVAMGNSGAEVKQAADYITKDVEKDGLFDAFVKLNLIR